MDEEDAWFVRGRIGYSFLPARWPGWVVIAGYVVTVHLLTLLPERLTSLRWTLIAIVTVGVIVIAHRTARRT